MAQALFQPLRKIVLVLIDACRRLSEIRRIGRVSDAERRRKILRQVIIVHDARLGLHEPVDKQKSHAEAVEIAREKPLGHISRQPAHALFHLAGRAVGECHAQHIIKANTVFGIGFDDAAGKHVRLPASRTSEHECRLPVKPADFLLARVGYFAEAVHGFKRSFARRLIRRRKASGALSRWRSPNPRGADRQWSGPCADSALRRKNRGRA